MTFIFCLCGKRHTTCYRMLGNTFLARKYLLLMLLCVCSGWIVSEEKLHPIYIYLVANLASNNDADSRPAQNIQYLLVTALICNTLGQCTFILNLIKPAECIMV